MYYGKMKYTVCIMEFWSGILFNKEVLAILESSKG